MCKIIFPSPFITRAKCNIHYTRLQKYYNVYCRDNCKDSHNRNETENRDRVKIKLITPVIDQGFNIARQFFLVIRNWENGNAKYRGRKKKSEARGLRDKRDCADPKPRPGREAGLNTFPLRYSASFTRQRRDFPFGTIRKCIPFTPIHRGKEKRAWIDCTLWIYPPERPRAVLHFVTTVQQWNYEALRVSVICASSFALCKKSILNIL